MGLLRDQVPQRVSEMVGGRPVRWTPTDVAVGDYDGRDRTLEIFNADVREQLTLLRALRPARSVIERAIGGPLVVLFHTSSETQRLYPEMSTRRRYGLLADRISEWMQRDHDEEPSFDPDMIEPVTIEAA